MNLATVGARRAASFRVLFVDNDDAARAKRKNQIGVMRIAQKFNDRTETPCRVRG